jgi:predicted DCC family thiol-disulfide oxidoreductase YuxK
VLYDGYCALCNRSVQFLKARQQVDTLEFASLQSKRGQNTLNIFKLPTTEFDTLVVVDDGRPYLRSAAALHLLRYLRFPWPLLGALRIVPAFMRDPVYNLIAHNRYRWLGKAS